MAISERARVTPASPIRRLAPLATEAKLKGRYVYHLNIGQPDIHSPPQFFEGLRLFANPVVEYEASIGSDQLRIAWSKFMNRELGLATKPEEFLITMGASEALVYSFMACCDPGDEIIIFDPTYANYMGFAAVTGVTLVPVATSIENNFAIPPLADVCQKISARTKAILVCSPNNPTGTVYTEAELRLLLSICEERKIFLLLDETYREFVYDGANPLSVLHLAPQSQYTVVLDSLSKRFSLCGARIGCLITQNAEFMNAVWKMAQARLAAPTIEQFAAAYMLDRIGPQFTAEVRKEYQARRDALYDALSGIKGIVAHKPRGAFYSVVQLPVKDAEDFATFMLQDFADDNETCFVAPAGGFYMEERKGQDKVRIAYVLCKDHLVRALSLLEAGLKAYGARS